MAKRSLKAGSTGVILNVFLHDAQGNGLAGLTSATSGLTCQYRRIGSAATVTVALSSGTVGTAGSGTFVAGGGPSGDYQLCLPDAAFASGLPGVSIWLYGAGSMVMCALEIALEAVDRQDAAAFGLSRLDATVSSRSTFAGGAVASVTAPVTVGTNNDKAGYSLSTAPPTASDVATAVWASVTRTLTTLNGLAPNSAFFANAPASSLTAADVWNYSARTLTAFGFSVAASNLPTDYQQRTQPVTLPTTPPAGYGGGTVDLSGIPGAVWTYATGTGRRLTTLDNLVPLAPFFVNSPAGSGGGADAAAIWSYPFRSLTGAEVSGPTSSQASGTALVLRGDDVYFDVTGVPDLTSALEIWVTLKKDLSDLDPAAALQVTKTDGLKYAGGQPGTSADAAISVQSATSIRVTLKPGASSKLPLGALYGDVQWRDDSGVHTRPFFRVTVTADVTRSY